MLSLSRQNSIVERIVTDRHGMVFRLVFAVTEENGKIKAKLLQAIPLGKVVEEKEVVLALPCPTTCFSQFEIFTPACPNEVISPYASVLEWKGLKPRAPAFV